MIFYVIFATLSLLVLPSECRRPEEKYSADDLSYIYEFCPCYHKYHDNKRAQKAQNGETGTSRIQPVQSAQSDWSRDPLAPIEFKVTKKPGFVSSLACKVWPFSTSAHCRQPPQTLTQSDLSRQSRAVGNSQSESTSDSDDATPPAAALPMVNNDDDETYYRKVCANFGTAGDIKGWNTCKCGEPVTKEEKQALKGNWQQMLAKSQKAGENQNQIQPTRTRRAVKCMKRLVSFSVRRKRQN